jgi:hypothetical protein
MKEPIQFFQKKKKRKELVLMIGFHSCENHMSIFNLILTCNDVN